MQQINDFFAAVSSLLWGWPMMILLLGTHIFLTIRLRCPQRKLFTAIRLSIKRDKDASGDVSQFGALATALAATIGTGNIIGVATAIALGGPGAVFWCWITGVFGIATKYAEGLLAIKYRVQTPTGKMLGGPMYALEKGLGWKTMAILFAIFTMIASFGIGNTVQANAIATIANNTYGISPWIMGAVVCGLTAAVIIGGVKSIAKVCGMLVPFMALFYIVLAVGVVALNIPRFPAVIESILAGAFNPAAFTGGTIGSLFISMQKGISRGIFSNEAGLGTGSIAHACADTRKPVKQGMFGIFEVFADTLVICTLTAMVILCSGTTVNYGTAAGAELTISGFTTTYGGWASIFTAVALCCFAFSTIIGWGLYGSRFLAFLCRSDKVVRPFFVVYSFVSILGATVDLGLLWSVADTFNGLMSIPNLIALLLLSGTVAKLTKEFFASEKANG